MPSAPPCNIVCDEIGEDADLGLANVPVIGDYSVDPETVGQYSGIPDLVGEKIFEGDILEHTTPDDKKQYISVVFERGAFLIDDHGIIEPDPLSSFVCLGLKVVGNVYDDAELLKNERRK